MDEKMDWVEYGGHTIRRALAEEVEEGVEAHKRAVRSYYSLLEDIASGRYERTRIIMHTSGEDPITLGEFLQDFGRDLADKPKDEDELRRKLVKDELEFGEALDFFHFRWGFDRDIDRFEGKEPSPDETFGEHFRLG